MLRRREANVVAGHVALWHLFAACEPGEDKLYGHIKPRKNRARFLEFCRYLRSLYPLSTRIAIPAIRSTIDLTLPLP